jgi:murein DD-endopeptidase MepM/ murein hydrolase activator NlpD
VKNPDPRPQVTPATLPTELPTPLPTVSPTPAEILFPSQPSGLIVPVQGVSRDQLSDTFTASRSEGRVHNAIDIMAPQGTPVIAVADGEIVKFHDSVPGGITIYQISSDGKYFFYYAHLQRRADGIAEKQFVPRGSTLGYVGDTGNAGPGNFHLHFAITKVADPKRFWEGENINPYPVLKGDASLP